MAYFEAFADVERDSRLVYDTVREKYPKLPTFLLGCSYGGLIVAALTQALDAANVPPSGACLLCPALSLEKLKKQTKNALLLPLVAQLSHYAPKVALGDKTPNHNYPLLQQDDELDDCTGVYTGKLRARVAAETLASTDRVRSSAAAIKAPLLIIHSRNDNMCDPEGSQFVYDGASSQDKTFLFTDMIDGCGDRMAHGLTQEPGSEAIAERVASWLIARAA